MSVLATVVVEFGEGVSSDELVVVELNDELNLNNKGETKTSFVVGDEPYFLVSFNNSTLRIGAVRSSSGMVINKGVIQKTAAQQLQFTAGTNTLTLRYPVVGAVNARWYGNIPVIVQTGNVLTAKEPLPAIGNVEYTIQATSFQLVLPQVQLDADNKWLVLIVVRMEAL